MIAEQDTAYEFHNGKLGIKIKYLIDDKKKHHIDSLKLIAYRTLKARMDSDTCSEKILRNGSFAGCALIQFSTLSREWKDRITTKFGSKPKDEIKQSWFAQHYIADRGAFDFYVGHRYGDSNEKKLELDKVELYTYNASVLNTVLQMKTNRKAYAKALGGVQIDIWDSLSKDVNAFREVAHNLPATRDGLRYKANKYAKALKVNQNEAYKTIISGRLQNSNAKKVADIEQMALLDELISKHTNLDNEIISSFYNMVAEKMNWKTIDAMTVSNRKKSKSLVTHAGRNGVKSLKNTKLMQVKRYGPTAPMYYWTLDGWTAELLYQDTALNSKGHNVTTYHNRLVVVVVLDAFNKYPIGYAVGTHETPELIKNALQNALQHTKQLFGDYYRPYEIQSDNYSVKKLRPIYQAVSPNFTPASVGNAKAKIIEPYFNTINKKYCKLMNNWSGHNVDSGSKNQPNTEFMNKIKSSFPDQDGCLKQIELIIETERSKKGKEFRANWINTKPELKQIMSLENYLLTFGSNTGDTNKLRGEGVVVTIEGEKQYFDSFDINFRHKSHLDWSIQYDLDDLSQVLAVSTDGKERFVLEQKYTQPMALADQTEADVEEWKRIKSFNKNAVKLIIEERGENARVLDSLFANPELNDTMAKHMLSDSIGQHKNIKSKERLAIHKTASKVVEKQAKKDETKKARTFLEEQTDYYSQQVDVNEYL